MRRLIMIVLALGVLAAIPSAAADGLTSDCETYRAASIPILHPALQVGEVQLCDEDDDGAFDTVAFETRYVHNQGFVSVTDEEKQRWGHQDRDTQAQFWVQPDVPGKVLVHQDLTAEDEGNDRQVDRIDTRGGIYTHLGEPRYQLTAHDDDGNGVPQRYEVLTCPAITCLGPRDVPQIPERIDLPDTIFRLPVVGYVP